jgi:hypothetical protein
MIYLENYLYDGAGWQPRAVMCYLQSRVECILDKTYTGDAWMPYKGQVFINQYHYGREKGYVFSVRYKGHQANYAVYEHCVADCICVVKGNAYTEHSDGWDGKEWSKYEHDKEFSYGETTKCGEWIEDDMQKEIIKWKIADGEKGYNDEKHELLNTIRKAAEDNGGFVFSVDDNKTFSPIYCGEPRKESIIEVYEEEPYGGEDEGDVIVVTAFADEDGKMVEERTNCAHFSNYEIKEIIKLLGI